MEIIMKKFLLVFILAFALLICGCDNAAPADNGSNSESNGKAVAISETQTFKLDAVNYDINDIAGIKKLGESGVVYAYCSSPESVNETVSVLNQLPDSGLTQYSTDNKNLVLLVVKLQNEAMLYILNCVGIKICVYLITLTVVSF